MITHPLTKNDVCFLENQTYEIIMIRLIELLGMFGGFITTGGLVLQVRKTAQTKTIKDMSWELLLFNMVGFVMTFVYSIVIAQPAIYIPLSISIGCTMFLIYVKYQWEKESYDTLEEKHPI
jgi:uncharacterized protein with PQ loop repeat